MKQAYKQHYAMVVGVYKEVYRNIFKPTYFIQNNFSLSVDQRLIITPSMRKILCKIHLLCSTRQGKHAQIRLIPASAWLYHTSLEEI